MRTWAGLMLMPWIVATIVAWGIRFTLMTAENSPILVACLLAMYMVGCPLLMGLLWITDRGRWLWKNRNTTNYKG